MASRFRPSDKRPAKKAVQAEPVLKSEILAQLEKLAKQAKEAERGWYSSQELADMAKIGADKMRRLLGEGRRAGLWEVGRVLSENVAGEMNRYLRWRPVSKD